MPRGTRVMGSERQAFAFLECVGDGTVRTLQQQDVADRQAKIGEAALYPPRARGKPGHRYPTRMEDVERANTGSDERALRHDDGLAARKIRLDRIDTLLAGKRAAGIEVAEGIFRRFQHHEIVRTD